MFLTYCIFLVFPFEKGGAFYPVTGSSTQPTYFYKLITEKD